MNNNANNNRIKAKKQNHYDKVSMKDIAKYQSKERKDENGEKNVRFGLPFQPIF